MRRLDLGNDAGMTIVELSIASFILLMISALMLTAMLMVSRTNQIVAQDTESLTTARIARARIEREIREADEIIATSDRDTLELWLDDNNDDIQDPAELITWEFIDLDAAPGGKAELIRSTGDAAPDQPQGVHYRSPIGATYNPFTYSPLPPGAEQVTITLIVEPESEGRGGQPVEISETVTARNVG